MGIFGQQGSHVRVSFGYLATDGQVRFSRADLLAMGFVASESRTGCMELALPNCEWSVFVRVDVGDPSLVEMKGAIAKAIDEAWQDGSQFGYESATCADS